MLIRTEQNLNGLPPNEATRQEGWDRWWVERTGSGLEGVKAAQRFIDEGQGRTLCL